MSQHFKCLISYDIEMSQLNSSFQQTNQLPRRPPPLPLAQLHPLCRLPLTHWSRQVQTYSPHFSRPQLAQGRASKGLSLTGTLQSRQGLLHLRISRKMGGWSRVARPRDHFSSSPIQPGGKYPQVSQTSQSQWIRVEKVGEVLLLR